MTLRLREERVQSATDLCDLFPSYDSGLSSLVAQEITRGNGKGVVLYSFFFFFFYNNSAI